MDTCKNATRDQLRLRYAAVVALLLGLLTITHLPLCMAFCGLSSCLVALSVKEDGGCARKAPRQ